MPLTISLGDFSIPRSEAPSPSATKNPEVHAAYQQLFRTVGDLKTLVRDYRKSLADLSRAHHETLVRLAQAAEFKDGDTGIHLIRIGQIAARIAREMRLDHEHCALLCRAAPMHDVGKIGIPDSILKKEGKLDANEWLIMQQHPVIGARLLGNSEVPLFHMAASIALNHHEKWDGSGYPYQRIGTAIPQEARIVALADCFDALTMDRCYRPAMDDDAAIALIVDESGRHFDPAVVEAFVAAAPDLIALRNELNTRYNGSGEVNLSVDVFDPLF